MFRPDANKPPKTLDVILGFSDGGTSCDPMNEPTVRIYMQRHPKKANQYIPLIVLQDHLSDEFIESTVAGVNELLMHGDASSRKFTRFSSKKRDKGPIPVVTFGNSESHIRLYRAHEMAQCEVEGAEIASHTLSNVDKTYCSVLSRLKLIMQRSEQPMSSDTLEATFTWPLGGQEDGKEDEIKDKQDSVVTSISKGGTFSGHSDGEGKRCNNNPSHPATHVDHMRVFTNSIVPEYQDGEKMITMRHGIPNTNKDHSGRCEIIGYFDCEGGVIKFIPWKEGLNKAIQCPCPTSWSTV